MKVTSKNLTKEAFSPFGRVFSAPNHQNQGIVVNQGRGRRYPLIPSFFTADADSRYPAPSLFRIQPSVSSFPLEIMEKHPFSAQLFIPIEVSRYLVVVAGGTSSPDLSTLKAFIAPGNQGISYHQGIWHAPLIALDRDSLFFSMLYETGDENDTKEVTICTHHIYFETLPSPMNPHSSRSQTLFPSILGNLDSDR